MLQIPDNEINTVKMIGIDPGTTNLGVAVLEVEIQSLEIVGSIAFTLNADRLTGKNNWTDFIHGNRFTRILALENELIRIFRIYNPVKITSESPFFNSRFPLAGMALVEIMTGIRNAVNEYDQWKSLNLVSPSEVKQALNAKGNCTKEIMLQKLMDLKNTFKYTGEIPLHQLDEHSVDALAVVYYSYIHIHNSGNRNV